MTRKWSRWKILSFQNCLFIVGYGIIGHVDSVFVCFMTNHRSAVVVVVVVVMVVVPTLLSLFSMQLLTIQMKRVPRAPIIHQRVQQTLLR